MFNSTKAIFNTNKYLLGVLVLLAFLIVGVMLSFSMTLTSVSPTPANFTNQTVGYYFINVTNNESFNLSGATVEWRNQSGVGGNISMTVDNMKNYTYINITNMLNGTHTFNVIVSNNITGSNISLFMNVTVDNGAPTSTINNPANSTITTNTTIQLSFTLTDNVATNLTYVIWDGAVAIMNGTALNNTLTARNVTSIANNTQIFRVEARDWPGTGTNSSTVYVTMATPLLSAVSPTPANFTNQTVQYYFINVTLPESINNATLEWTNQSGTRGNISMTYDVNKNYTYINVTNMLNGTHMFIVWVNDSLVNLNYSLSMNVTVDNGNPTSAINNPANNTFTANRTLELRFTLTDNVATNLTYVIWDGTVALMNGTALNNTLTGRNITSLANGTHVFKVEARDWPLTGVNSTPLHFYVVTPNLTAISPTPANFTNQTLGYYYLNISFGDSINNATLEWTNQSGTRGNISMTYDVNKNYTYINVTNMLNGTHMFIVWVNDSVNNLNYSISMNVTVDNGAPTSTINMPANNTVALNTTAQLSFTLTDNIATNLTYVIWDISTALMNGTALNNTLTGMNISLSIGTHIFRIEARDWPLTGTNSTAVYVTVGPNLTAVSPTLANFTNQTAGYYYINVTNSHSINNASVEWRNQSGVGGNITMTYDSVLNYTYINITNMLNGTHMFVVWVNDSTNNLNYSLTLNVTVDNGPPTVKLVGFYLNDTQLNVTGNMTNTTDSIPEFVLNATDNVATNLTYIVYVDGAASMNGTMLNYSSLGAPSSLTRVNITQNTIGLLNGSHLITVEVADYANNRANTTQINLTVDTTPPVIVISSPLNVTAGGTYGRNISLNYVIIATPLPAVNCWYANGLGNLTNLTNCNTNITFLSDNANGINNITFYANDTVGNINSTIIFYNSSTFQLYLNIQNSTFNNVPNVTVSIAKMAMGPGQAQETWNSTTDANGNVTIGNLDNTWQQPFQFTIAGYNGSDMTNATYVGPILPPLPGNMLNQFMNGTTLYLAPAANIIITASNSTHGTMAFRGEVFDAKLKFPIASFNSQDVSNYSVSVPRNRNYTVTVYKMGNQNTQGSPPNSVTVTDVNLTSNNNVNITAPGGSVPFVYQVNISLAVNLVNLSGLFVNGSNVSQVMNATNMNVNFTAGVLEFNTMGGQISPDMVMPVFSADSNHQLMMNLTTGTTGRFNVPVIANRSLIMLFSANDSSTYYAGFLNISLAQDADNINISLYPLAGSLVRGGLVNVSMTNFSLVDGTNASNITSAGQAHLEMNVTYPTGPNTNLSIAWMLDSNSNGNFQLYMFNNRTPSLRNAKIRVMSNRYAPREFEISPGNLFANSTINITLKRFSMEGSDGSRFSSVSIYFLVSNSTCDVPNPNLTIRQSGGCLIASANSNNFNPLTIMTAGKLSVRMVDSSGITLQYAGADLLASGPPDGAYDTAAAETRAAGGAISQVWKFGSMGPKIYDKVLIGVPYSSSAYDDSQAFTIKARYLYDQNWNVIWNMSAGNSTNDLPLGYEDYGTSTYEQYVNKSDTGMPCSKTATNSTCFVNTTSHTIWYWLPHFSSEGGENNGTGSPPTFTAQSVATSVSSSGATMTATTNKAATCRFNETDMAYSNMVSTFSTTGGTSHSTAITGLGTGVSYTYYIRCIDSYGNAMASAGTYGTVSFSTSSGSSTTGGGTSGGSVVSNKATNVYTEMDAGVVNDVKIADPEIGLKQIFIEVNDKALSVTITVSKYSGQPASVTQNVSGTVYQFLEITHDNLIDSNIKSANIRFNVTKTWLTTNGYDAGDVYLKRYNSTSGWTKLTTSKVSESASEVAYEAGSPGLSVFAITAEKAAAPPAAAVCGNNIREGTEQCDGTDLGGQTCVAKGFTGGTLKCKADCTFDTTACTSAPVAKNAVCGNGVCETGETPENCPADCGKAAPITVPYWLYVLIVIVVVIVIGGYIYYYKWK